ncbi:MAG: ATP-binding cassette domain-containing protein [Saprospiraceae bacterium]|nr:ATP-binding cassette domain-containing protein [Saprospiraceae bacterium]MCZ2336823.1 ABC transporter ATP-binding protein [Chitinophagales bacterium]
MHVLSLQDVVKQYANHKAVDGVSFDVKEGSIFGLLGPNGAGKTSMIRIITSITAADSGRVLINGEPLNFHHPNQIGYMPEERGLYKKMKVGEQLMYLAQLKGLTKKEAKSRIVYWLQKFDIKDWWNKKISDLSKGMSQKVQFIATIVHDPSLIILDEPFTGLDPINTNLIKDEIYNLKLKGTSIIFSTHRMEQVEEICDDIVLINKGRVVLNGSVKDIKQNYKENKFKVVFEGELSDGFKLPDATILDQKPGELIFKINENQNVNLLLETLIRSGISIISFNEILPSLNDIFITKVASTNE